MGSEKKIYKTGKLDFLSLKLLPFQNNYLQTDQATSVTQGCQTDKTHQRNCTNTQTYRKVDGHTQTKVDNYMNTKRPKVFISGLRGERKNICPFVMDLSEPLEYTQPIKK